MQANPKLDDQLNTVELQLATVLHHHQQEYLSCEKASDLREWLSDILWSGQQGYAQMTREELLECIADEIIENFDPLDAVVEDVVGEE